MESKAFVLWFDEIGISDVPSVGGKNASLGEMYRELSQKGVKVPYGFAITAHAYRHFLEKAGIRGEIEETLKGLDTGAVANLRERGRKIRTAIVDAELPKELEDAIVGSYKKLCERYGEDTGAAPQRRIYLLPALQVSRRPISISTGRLPFSLHARGASPPFSPTGPYHTGLTRDSTT